MMHRHPDLGSASDWLCCVGNLIQPIRSTTQIWVVMYHQYGISALVSQTSFGRGTSGSFAKCQLFSQDVLNRLYLQVTENSRNFGEEGNHKDNKPTPFTVNTHT